MSGYLIFGGIDSRDYDVFVSFSDIDTVPRRVYTKVDIVGKNGSVLIDEGKYEDVPHSYDCIVLDNEKRVAFVNAIMSKRGYQRLTDSYGTDEYYTAVLEENIEQKTTRIRDKYKFKLVFTRKPQRFLTSGEVPLDLTWKYEALEEENSITITDEEGNGIDGGTTPTDTITNPTLFESQPLIIVTGSGQVSIGDQIITVTDIPAGTDVYIDCESMEIYTNTGGIISGASSHVAFNKNSFPTIAPGEQGFSKTAPVLIIPRWWRL